MQNDFAARHDHLRLVRMTSLPETRDSLLARLAAPDDAQAWTEFTTIYERALLRYCRSRGLQDADASEVVQQVLAAVHQRIGQWRPSGQPGAFRAWLWQTTRRLCLGALRQRVRFDRATGGTTELMRLGQAQAPSQAADEELWDSRRWAFCWAASQVEREIEPVTWQAFWRTAVLGEPAAEVADRLGVRIGSVYTARCRVLARIRKAVDQLQSREQ